MNFEKEFDFINLEKSIYNEWEKQNCFKPKKNKNTFSIMMPPPNITGSLHLGHALTFTIQDILIRYNRMLGKEVLWQAGTDHAGIATQMVVERQLKKNNIERKDLSREEFIKHVWSWKNNSGNIISNQLRRLGSSADWSRERFTMDEGLSVAVKKVFVDLYNDKIIYKDKRLVNWDPKLLTAVSDLEVEQKEQEGILWHIKYPLENDQFIIIATTRPETMFGDTAVAVHPDDKRYRNLIGKYCQLPLADRQIKIIADEYADPDKGSGAVKITPAHDFNDFEVGIRNKLDFINILNKDASLNNNVPKKFIGLDRYEARNLILKELKHLNLLVKEEKQIMVVPYGDRSGVVIEPLLTDQWFCDAKKLSIDPIKSVKNGSTKFVPKQWEKTFFNWMNNIQPWCISRQLWWGHQIPAWYGQDGKIFVAMDKQDAENQASKFYTSNFELTQDNDVLDTWFSSALWTFSTLDWPRDSYELQKFYPSSVLVTGFDIIFFWVARMMMMGSYFIKKTPFNDVYIHPLIRDEKGQKMSKSKGNIIDPIDLLDKYGADTLRFTLTSLLNPGRDIKLSEERVKGYKSFTNKIWNAAKFLQINECKIDNNFDVLKITSPLNQWIYNEFAKTLKKIQEDMNKYHFNDVANGIYHFIWHTYCDWYIEFSKTTFQNKSSYLIETKNVSMWIFLQILKISHPIIPFITERLWQIVKNNDEFLMNQKLENYHINNNYEDSQNNIKNLFSIISSIRNLRSELNISYKNLIEINFDHNDKKFIVFLNLYLNELKNILKAKKITFNEKLQSKGIAYIVVKKTTIKIPLTDVIDTKQEIKRLNAKKTLLLNNLEKNNLKLKNSSFLQNAPKEIIDKFEKDAEELKSSIEKIDQIIDTIR